MRNWPGYYGGSTDVQFDVAITVPNATYIGFTGTPIDRTAYGQGTFKTFGMEDDRGYLHKYPIAESIEDKTTLPLYYNVAPNEMLVPTDVLESEFLALAEAEGNGVNTASVENRAVPRGPDYGYIAYIDESGDEGLRAVKPIDRFGSSEWLILSAVVVSAARENEVVLWVQNMVGHLRNHQRRSIHFSDLNPAKKRFVCSRLATVPVRCFVILSNKKNMKGYRNPFAEQIPSRNWFYCWLVSADAKLSRVAEVKVTHL